MSLGLAAGTVWLARAHNAWNSAYLDERSRIVTAIGPHLLDIQHGGSTSIPNVPAKPILDILIGVRDFDTAKVCVEPIVAIGYLYRGEYGIPRRHYFVKGEPRTHHLHMLETSSHDWRVTLQFRDLLRANPLLADEYAREKERLARLHSNDRDAYQKAKDHVVEKILARTVSESSPGTRMP